MIRKQRAKRFILLQKRIFLTFLQFPQNPGEHVLMPAFFDA